MADYNEPLERLSQLDPQLPANNETADKTPAMIRQLRAFLARYLAVAHADDGKLKPLSLPSVVLQEASVRGSSANSGGETQEIAPGTVSTPDLRNDAVTADKLAAASVEAAKLAANAVETAKIADGAVTALKLAANAVESAKILDNAVTAAKLQSDASNDANRAVGTNHLKDAAVTDAKIANTTISPGKLAAMTSANVLVGNGTGVVAASIGGAVSATLVGSVLQFAIGGTTNGGASRLAVLTVEKAQNSNLVSGDFAAAYTGTVQHVKFTNEYDPGGIISLDANGSFVFPKVGAYAVFAQIDFDSGTFSRLLLGKVNSGGTGYDSYVAASNGAVLLGIINTTAENSRFALVFKDAALSATQGTAKNVLTGERYATLVVLAL